MVNKKHIYIGIIVLAAVLVSTFIIIGGIIFPNQGPNNGEQEYDYKMFYDYPELESGTMNFSTCPLAMDAISKIPPLGNLNPEMGHSFPTTHSGLDLNDTETEGAPYEVKAPADGFIVEISINDYNPSTGFGDIHIVMAHTKDVLSAVDHVSKLSDNIKEHLDTIEEGFDVVKIPINEGDVIAYAGGNSAPAVGMDWNIFDQTIAPHFIKSSRYNRKAYAVGLTNRTEGELKSNITAKLSRTQPPKIGILDFDKEGYIVGNWFYENITEYEDPMGQWDKLLGIVYAQYNSTQIRICTGGILNLNNTLIYQVSGNSPDPATINSTNGPEVYNLTSTNEFTNDKRTLMINHTGNQKIRIQAWEGHIADPTFNENSKYYIR